MNSDIIRCLYDALAKGDVPGVLGALDDEVSWTEAEVFPYGGTYVGPDAVVENVFAKLGSEWDGFSAVPESFVVDGDSVDAFGIYSGTYEATGKAFTAPFVHSWTLRGGKVVRFSQYTDTVLVQRALR